MIGSIYRTVEAGDIIWKKICNGRHAVISLAQFYVS